MRVNLALVDGGYNDRAAKDWEGTRGLKRDDWESTESRLLVRLIRYGLFPPWPPLLVTDSRRDEELYLLDRRDGWI